MRIITLVPEKRGAGKSTLPTAIAVTDARSNKLLAFLVLVGLALTVVLELIQPSNSCERHKGDFSADFSPPDFDINSVDCRVPWLKNSATIRFWGVHPYIGVNW